MNIFEFRERGNSGVAEETEQLAQRVIGAIIEVHKQLGPGLPESVYRKALVHELGLLSIACQTEMVVPIVYKGIPVGETRLDLLVEGVLIVELKVVETLNDVHRAQVISYLKATKLHLGLLVNFNVTLMRDGIKRVINTV